MPNGNDPVFNEENTHLSKTVDKVSNAKDSLKKQMDEMGAVNLKKLKELRENPASNATDFYQFLNLLEEKNAALNIKDKYQKLEELAYLSKEPYFSRIDLVSRTDKEKGAEKDNGVSYYIGKFGFSEGKDPLVIDWRAKIASIYYKYRYPQKNITYETPDGTEEADLTLKRTFEIDDGELIKYYNNDIKLDETEIIVDKIQERTGGVLEDIVETIQKNQHEIIESDPREVCVVQGTVGSGKSTVAIHKLSYIFFNYQKLIKPEKSILIAKNQILVGYLSTLFPKLGIFNINYGTIRDVIYKLLFKENINVKFDLSKNLDTSSFGLKQIKELNNEVQKIHRKLQDKVENVFATEETEPFGGFVYDPTQSARENLTEAINDINEELKFQKDFMKENPNNSRSELFKKNIKIMRKIVRQLTKIRSGIKTKHLNYLVKKFGLSKQKEYGYFEALVYLLIYHELIGFNKYEKFEYCIVDEGQDFSVLEYSLLNKLVKNGRFCILGDLNQSFSDEGLSSWEDIYEVVTGSKHSNKFTLETNYRSTKPIIDFANKILKPYTDDYLPKSINRRGKDPEFIKLDTFNDVANDFRAKLKNDLKKQEKSIGIICMNNEYVEKMEEILRNISIPKDKFIRLRETDRISYLPRAVYLTHFNSCKGLEFGKVYVVGLDIENIRSFTEAKRSFVAVTRAMDELVVYADRENKE